MHPVAFVWMLSSKLWGKSVPQKVSGCVALVSQDASHTFQSMLYRFDLDCLVFNCPFTSSSDLLHFVSPRICIVPFCSKVREESPFWGLTEGESWTIAYYFCYLQQVMHLVPPQWLLSACWDGQLSAHTCSSELASYLAHTDILDHHDVKSNSCTHSIGHEQAQWCVPMDHSVVHCNVAQQSSALIGRGSCNDHRFLSPQGHDVDAFCVHISFGDW